MSRFNAPRIASLAAIAAACFSTGVVLAMSGCFESGEIDRAPARNADSVRAAEPSVDSAATPVTPKLGEATRQMAAASAAAPVRSMTSAASPTRSLADATTPARVRRLVVTNGVEKREPLATEALTLGNGPVYAFVELENAAIDEQSIIVTFERSGQPAVGHVKLAVPGTSPRFRTWGLTRQIREAGTWEAVVRSPEGRELARTAFEVIRSPDTASTVESAKPRTESPSTARKT
jgi:hypothetical protein